MIDLLYAALDQFCDLILYCFIVQTSEKLHFLLPKGWAGQRAMPCWMFREDTPYLAQTLGSTPSASRIKIGVCGLFFFIVG